MRGPVPTWGSSRFFQWHGSRPVGARRRSVLAVRETAELGRPGRTAGEAHCARHRPRSRLCIARKSSAARPLQALAATRLQPWWCAKYHLLLQVGSEQDRSRCRRGCVEKRRMHSSARGVVHDLLRSRLASNGLSCWPSLHAAVRPRKHAHVFVYVVCTIKSF